MSAAADRVWRWASALPPLFVDALVAPVLCLVYAVPLVGGRDRPVGAVTVLVVVVASGSLVGRRRWPMAVLLVTVIAVVIADRNAGGAGTAELAVVIALATLAAVRGWRLAVAAAVGTAVILVVSG